MDTTPITSSFCFSSINGGVVLYNKNMSDRMIGDIKKILTSPQWNSLSGNKLTLEAYDDYLIHIFMDDIYAYFIFANTNYDIKRLYGTTNDSCFFNELSSFVKSNYTKSWSRHSKFFDDLYEKYFLRPDKIKVAKNQINEITGTMSDAINKTIERGDKVSILNDKAIDLNMNAEQFKSGTTRLKNKMCWQNTKLMFLIGAIVIVILVTIIIIVAANL